MQSQLVMGCVYSRELFTHFPWPRESGEGRNILQRWEKVLVMRLRPVSKVVGHGNRAVFAAIQ
jgi:hypothetical protein